MSEQDKQNPLNKRMIIILRVNEQAERFYGKAQELGKIAALSFNEMKSAEKSRHRSQMTGLENIADTTLKVSDVLDYIKKQIARRQAWTAVVDGQRFGESLKTYIENDLKNMVNKVCESVGIGNETEEDMRDRQRIHLDLTRQLIRQIVVHYEYAVSPAERPAQ
ncbi:MAG: hypothetical protein ACRDHZ_03640 [Ktedonobacteraceae bacterium]